MERIKTRLQVLFSLSRKHFWAICDSLTSRQNTSLRPASHLYKSLRSLPPWSICHWWEMLRSAITPGFWSLCSYICRAANVVVIRQGLRNVFSQHFCFYGHNYTSILLPLKWHSYQQNRTESEILFLLSCFSDVKKNKNAAIKE